MKPTAFILPGIIILIAGALYGFGTSVAPRIGPGWDQIVTAIAGFIAIIGALVAVSRLARASTKQKQ